MIRPLVIPFASLARSPLHQFSWIYYLRYLPSLRSCSGQNESRMPHGQCDPGINSLSSFRFAFRLRCGACCPTTKQLQGCHHSAVVL